MRFRRLTILLPVLVFSLIFASSAFRQLRPQATSVEDLVADHGFHASYLTVQRFVRRLRGSQPVLARAVIFTPPGEEAASRLRKQRPHGPRCADEKNIDARGSSC